MADNWLIEEWSGPIAKECLQALGVMSVRYNLLERTLQDQISTYLETVPHPIRDQLLHPLNNSQRSAVLRRIAEEMEPIPALQTRLRHFLRGFSICAENRNVALHADAYAGDTHFHMFKIQSEPPYRENSYPVSLEELRAICDAMEAFRTFGRGISLFVRWRVGRSFPPPGFEMAGPIALPEIPPLPRKLTPHPPDTHHPDGPIFF